MDPLRAGFDEIGAACTVSPPDGPAGLVAAGFEGLDAVEHPLLGLGPPPGAGVAGHLAGIGRQRRHLADAGDDLGERPASSARAGPAASSRAASRRLIAAPAPLRAGRTGARRRRGCAGVALDEVGRDEEQVAPRHRRQAVHWRQSSSHSGGLAHAAGDDHLGLGGQHGFDIDGGRQHRQLGKHVVAAAQADHVGDEVLAVDGHQRAVPGS
jgi:hypothetical protein